MWLFALLRGLCAAGRMRQPSWRLLWHLPGQRHAAVHWLLRRRCWWWESAARFKDGCDVCRPGARRQGDWPRGGTRRRRSRGRRTSAVEAETRGRDHHHDHYHERVHLLRHSPSVLGVVGRMWVLVGRLCVGDRVLHSTVWRSRQPFAPTRGSWRRSVLCPKLVHVLEVLRIVSHVLSGSLHGSRAPESRGGWHAHFGNNGPCDAGIVFGLTAPVCMCVCVCAQSFHKWRVRFCRMNGWFQPRPSGQTHVGANREYIYTIKERENSECRDLLIAFAWSACAALQ